MNSTLPPEPRQRFTRRQVIAGAIAVGAAAAITRPAVPASAARAEGVRHLVWTWQFSIDAAPNLIGAQLRENDLGMLLKTHDGVEWMSEYDTSPFAVTGPSQVETLTRYYEDAGVPFHAWFVIKGINVMREARMAADVLSAGVRSLFIDLEPYDGFWRGGPAEAIAFGNEVRRLQPNGHIVLSIDPRPWVAERLPMKEFASFSNELAPQNYWRSFNTSANYERYAQMGMPVPSEGVTPEFITETTHNLYAGLGLPISPAGQGASDVGEFSRFVDTAYALGSQVVSVWRYGVTVKDLFPLLRNRPPNIPAPVQIAAAIASGNAYTVESGDTLYGIASKFDVSMDAIVQANGLSDANYLYVGQQLVIPGFSGSDTGASSASTSQAPSPGPIGGGGGKSYTVQSGDTLSKIAGTHGTTVGAIAQINGISDPNFLHIGQVLGLP